MKLVYLSLISSMAVAACSTPEADFVARLGTTPTLDGGTYSTGGGLTVAADVREKDGNTLVCGAWAQSRQQSVLSQRGDRRVLPTGVVYLGDERVMQNFLFMREVSPSANYSGEEANCRLIDRPWQVADASRELSIRIPRQVIDADYDEYGGQPIVYFYQTGPGAGTR